MNTTIQLAGIACIIAAIIGGGLRAFGVDFPPLGSLKRQFLLAIFGIVLLVVTAGKYVVISNPAGDFDFRLALDRADCMNNSYILSDSHTAYGRFGKQHWTSADNTLAQEDNSPRYVRISGFQFALLSMIRHGVFLGVKPRIGVNPAVSPWSFIFSFCGDKDCNESSINLSMPGRFTPRNPPNDQWTCSEVTVPPILDL
jgi:hypothetical protein